MSNTDMGQSLLFKAGAGAFREIRKHGFAEELIGTIAGASGGAKWLVLSQIDRVLLDRVVPRLVGPVHLIGSSIGAWRFSCYAQSSPIEAIDRFETAYLEQAYSDRPDVAEITAKSTEALAYVLGESGAQEICGHDTFRTHVMTVRSRFMTSTDVRPLLAVGLMTAMTANAVSRRSLGAFFSRALFFDERDLPPFFDVKGFPLQRVALTEDNLNEVVIASSSIPMVLAGVRDIAGAPAGVYRDGGVIDYHLDLPLAADGRFTLYPHFFDWLKPGWFDKRLPWRSVSESSTDRTILVCPSPEFISKLPHGKVPDRTDFVNFDTDERQRIWRECIASCRQLADELADVLDKGQLAARLQPL